MRAGRRCAGAMNLRTAAQPADLQVQRDKLCCRGQGRSTRDLSHPAVHAAEVEISAQSSRLSEYEHYFSSLCVFLWEQVL